MSTTPRPSYVSPAGNFSFSFPLGNGKEQGWASKGLALEADLLLHPDSFLVIHLTEFQCVSSALVVHCPSATDCAQWLEKTQQAQVCESQAQAPGAQRRSTERRRESASRFRREMPSGGRCSLDHP